MGTSQNELFFVDRSAKSPIQFLMVFRGISEDFVYIEPSLMVLYGYQRQTRLRAGSYYQRSRGAHSSYLWEFDIPILMQISIRPRCLDCKYGHAAGCRVKDSSLVQALQILINRLVLLFGGLAWRSAIHSLLFIHRRARRLVHRRKPRPHPDCRAVSIKNERYRH